MGKSSNQTACDLVRPQVPSCKIANGKRVDWPGTIDLFEMPASFFAGLTGKLKRCLNRHNGDVPTSWFKGWL